ncbi:hypothetical protein IPC965_20820 [Pseudomonas aeruginosa]|uniref:sugar phosphate nucleotidyltransferase n=1 Tax=Pseudomonas aeruginosa TaxID=287 RepID=UPI000F530B37|nr:sugar phosphate nucleotidyltransferase [Pseudomonas aeruginosa]RPT49340.1 hypothetical protein IPC965_20820 [Pseudomonas aeruginosa]
MLIPVVLSGGAGTRLWPVSREGQPKPFMRLPDGQTLLGKTYRRAAGLLAGHGEIVTVTNREHYFQSKDQFHAARLGRHRGHFILEPTGRNTAPAIAVAALALQAEHGDAAGLGMILGVLNVFFRDVGQLFGICLQFWFWLTPIVYPIGILPEGIRSLIELNPMTALMRSYQQLFLHGQWPDWPSLLPITLLALLLCALGLRLFRQRVGEMVDEL